MKKRFQYIPGVLLFAVAATPLVASVTIPNAFQSGETAVAEEVNANFEALRDEIESANSRISELESDLEEREKFFEHVQVVHDDPHDANALTVRFSGVDLQIVNGEGETDSTNGVGNLIVGYNESRSDSATVVCSDATYLTEEDCNNVGETWAENHKSGSHNIVGGSGNAYSSYGGLVVGEDNAINREYASVSGGEDNVASGRWSSVTGGSGNTSGGNSTNVSGGSGNTAAGFETHVSGGTDNTADSIRSSILGGSNQQVGGEDNTIPAIAD